MKGYKLDCCLSSKDTHVLSCSEDGHVYCWDLVEVTMNLIFKGYLKGLCRKQLLLNEVNNICILSVTFASMWFYICNHLLVSQLGVVTREDNQVAFPDTCIIL